MSLTNLIAAWFSGSKGYDLEKLSLMSAFGKLTSVSFPILLCISCSLWVCVSLGNECLLMSLGRRDFNIWTTSWEVLFSLIWRDCSGLLVYFPFLFSSKGWWRQSSKKRTCPLLYSVSLLKTVTFSSQLNWIGYKQFRQRKVFFFTCLSRQVEEDKQQFSKWF